VTHALDEAREKLKRARAHGANLKRQVTLLNRDPSRHRVLVDYDPDEGCYVVYSKMGPEPLPDLSLVLGDVIHNARGALDFTAWQLARKKLRREPTEKEAPSIVFPITSSIVMFDNRPIWRFVSKQVRCEMLRHQPHPRCDPGNDHLAALHWISNRDKHRFVVPLLMLVGTPRPPNYTFKPKLPEGTEARWIFSARPSEVFYKRDPTTRRLAKVVLTPRPPNTQVEIDPQPPLNVLFGGPGDALTPPDIKALLDRVEFVVGCFDRFL
jgi:hypothetical protein